MVALGLLACALLAFALISRRVEGTIVTGPMLFVAFGLACGWTGLVDFGSALHGDDHETAREVVVFVAELALVLLLFADAMRIDPRGLRGNPLPARLLGIGLPLTIGLGAGLGLLVLTELEPWDCAIVAAVLAPTDAALGQVVVSSPAVPERVRDALGVESGRGGRDDGRTAARAHGRVRRGGGRAAQGRGPVRLRCLRGRGARRHDLADRRLCAPEPDADPHAPGRDRARPARGSARARSPSSAGSARAGWPRSSSRSSSSRSSRSSPGRGRSSS